MSRLQGWLIVSLLAFLCVHVLAADVVGLYLYVNIGDSASSVISDDPTSSVDQPDDTQTDFPECDPELDLCP